MRERILVSDAETPAAVAVVRSLTRSGHRVSVLAWSRFAAGERGSRRAGVFRVPRPDAAPDAWAAALARIVRQGAFRLFLPVTDVAATLANRIRTEVPGAVLAAVPQADRLGVLTDKRAVLRRADALGIPVLPSWSGGEVARAELPAVVKPLCSRVETGGRIASATAVVVGNREALVREIGRLEEAGFGCYVEPWVPGEGRGIFLLVHGGRILARFAHRRIREASPLGGPSAVCESVAAEPSLLAAAERLARDLNVEGPFMAEFRGGVLLEVNARYWGSLALAPLAGVDFPSLHVRALLSGPEPGPDDWRLGVRGRNLVFDLRHAVRASLARPPGLGALPWPGRISVWRDLLSENATDMLGTASRAYLLDSIRKVIGHGP